MHELGTVFNAVIPVFLIMGTAFAFRRVGWLTAEADQSLLRLTINLLMPCLLFDAALGNPALARWDNLVLAPLVGAGTFLFGLLLAWGTVGLSGLREASARRTFILTVGLYNYGYIPIPLALLLFGERTVGVLAVHNVGVELLMWTVGLMVLTGSGTGTGIRLRQLLNAPLISILLALGLNFAGLTPYLPKPLLVTFHVLAQCAIPMSLILIGATIADHLEHFHEKIGLQVIGIAVLLRLLVLPVCFLLLASSLTVSVELKQVIVIEAAMPSAVFPIVMARHYKGDPATALRVVIGTSLLGLITIPLWIHLGMRWVGLS